MSISNAATCMTAVDDVKDETGAAFQREYERCAPGIFRFLAVRTGDSHTAEDLMQQAWIQARPRASGLPVGEVEPYLRTVARNLIRLHWRQRASRPAGVPIADPSLAAELSRRLVTEDLPSDVLARREIQDQLLLALTQIRSEDQQLIISSYFDGLPHAELAGRLGVTERAVEGRLYRARLALRSALEELED